MYERPRINVNVKVERGLTSTIARDTSVKYRPTIGEVSAKCRRNVGEVSVNEKLYRPRHIWNDYRPCLDRVSTHYRPTIDRYIDRLLTECRPSIDRVSTECRPTIDRVSTAISTDISVDITHSKQDPIFFSVILDLNLQESFVTLQSVSGLGNEGKERVMQHMKFVGSGAHWRVPS